MLARCFSNPLRLPLFALADIRHGRQWRYRYLVQLGVEPGVWFRELYLKVNRLSGYHGGLGPEFSFVRVTVPECLPERLEIISYANEYAFLYDGKHVSHGFQQGLILMTCWMRWGS
jgi:hypothetical protein